MTTTGTDLLRALLLSYIRHGSPATIARELNVSAADLDTFARGKAKLSAETLDGLAKYFYNSNTTFDAAIDRLRPINQAIAIPMGIQPPVLQGVTLPTFKGGPPPAAPGMVSPAKPKVPRPGWVE